MKIYKTILISMLTLFMVMSCGMFDRDGEQTSNSGIKQAAPPVIKTAGGLSVEQSNIHERLRRDNEPGSIKWIYGIQFGQVLFRASVVGKVTSSSKRLEPTSVTSIDGTAIAWDFNGMPVEVSGKKHRTSEVIQADGTFGSSSPYVYWYDENDRYWQWSGDYIISDTPVKINSAVLNFRDIDAEEQAYATQIENQLKADKK